MLRSRGLTRRCLFRKKDKLKNKIEIKDIIHNGRKKVCPVIDIYFKKNNKDRIGIVIKKTHKSPERNKIKRRIREIYRKNKKRNGCDIVFKIKEEIFTERYREIEKEIIKILEEIEKNE